MSRRYWSSNADRRGSCRCRRRSAADATALPLLKGACSISDYRWTDYQVADSRGRPDAPRGPSTQPAEPYSRTPCTATTRGDARLGGASPLIRSADTATRSATADSPRRIAVSPWSLASLSSRSLARTTDSSTRYRTVSSSGIERRVDSR